MNSIKEIYARLDSAASVAIFIHTKPDGDAIGSAFALKRILKKAGKAVSVVSEDPLPARLSFISGGDEPVHEIPEGTDTIVCVDVASPLQLGYFADALKDRIDIKIDHHAFSPLEGKIEITRSSAAAAAEIVYELALEFRGIDPECATMLYAALVSDTGNFIYSNTTKDTLRIASELVCAGADSFGVSTRLFDTKTEKDISVIRYIYDHMHSFLDGKIRTVTFTNHDKNLIGVTDEDLSDASSILRQIEGTLAAFSIREDPKTAGKYRISARSCPPVDCCEICKAFGGGGHIRASGCNIYADTIAEAEEKLVEECLKRI